MAFLEIDDVHKSYGHHEVLKGVTLNVERHEVVCLIGASGLRQVDAAAVRERLGGHPAGRDPDRG